MTKHEPEISLSKYEIISTGNETFSGHASTSLVFKECRFFDNAVSMVQCLKGAYIVRFFRCIVFEERENVDVV